MSELLQSLVTAVTLLVYLEIRAHLARHGIAPRRRDDVDA